MKTTPLLTLAVTVIASVLLNSCSLISSKHYNLNLVKVEQTNASVKNAKATKDVVKNAENRMYVSAEKSYVPEEISTVKLKTTGQLANNINANNSLNKNLLLKSKKNKTMFRKSTRNQLLSIKINRGIGQQL